MVKPNETITEYHNGQFHTSTDKTRFDIDFVHQWLSESSYWAQSRPRDIVEKAIENSVCFGVFDGDQQVGFARLVTDHATFAWLCDVFIAESHRGRGLGKWLIQCITTYADETWPNLRILLLATRDAHGLYRRYGDFSPLDKPEKWMVKWKT